MTRLIDFRSPRRRFARSINLERDAGGNAVDGYLPVGRAIDVISRLAGALNRDDVEAALAITGPYGSGKSSLAVVLDALFGPQDEPARVSAEEILDQAAPQVLASLVEARSRFDADADGFIRAVATAQREPIVATVLRALIHGAERYRPPPRRRAAHRRVLSELRRMQSEYTGGDRVRSDARAVRDAVISLSRLAPVLLLIDEFGKNLEAFGDSGSDADVYVLQELAEWSRAGDDLPLALVTFQHMTFDDYASGVRSAQRREWAKVQGRFDEIPFVDGPAQSQALIAAAFEDPHSSLEPALTAWAAKEADALERSGIRDVTPDPALFARCWPLHPTTLAALPELCQRYGQYERTLFSFLAGNEPHTVTSFLTDTVWHPGEDLPSVRLDQVYDYFVESAATMVSVSARASRWLEIDGRLRDAHRLGSAAQRVAKTVGLLNLVSAGGRLRAREPVVVHAASDGREGTRGDSDVLARLAELSATGLITFRDFADEYRVWQGSDFDIKGAIDSARHRLRQEPAASVLNRVLPLSPVIAARHSHTTGTLRAFDRRWVDSTIEVIEPPVSDDRADGSALYMLGAEAPTTAVVRREHEKPIVFITTSDPSKVLAAALEVAAIDDVVATAEGLDWVARRELIERRIEAGAALEHEVEHAYGPISTTRGPWQYAKPGRRRRWSQIRAATASIALSKIADHWYGEAPVIRNDLVNRHDLSSQAAKARRELVEAMLAHPHLEGLGIEGFGPDKTMYLSTLRDLGLHQSNTEGFEFTAPNEGSSLRNCWDELVGLIRLATDKRANVTDIYRRMAAPPYGVRSGVAPLLLIAALQVYANDIAVYEHGTFKPILTAEVCERLLRNPGNFELKHFSARSGSRASMLTFFADRLQVPGPGMSNRPLDRTVVAVVSHLVATIVVLPDHIKKTRHLSSDAVAIRAELLTAIEPDELLFTAIPGALGKPGVSATGGYGPHDLEEIADRTAAAVDELRNAYAAVLHDLRDALREALRGSHTELRVRVAARARELHGTVIDPKVGRLVAALTAEMPGDDEWVEYVAMSLTDKAPATWTDADRTRFYAVLHDVGGTFRRIEALNVDLRSRGEGFDALRLTITRPDGTETAKLVWVDESHRAALTELATEMVRQARDMADSDAEARDVLLAVLAEGDLAHAVDSVLPLSVTPASYSEGSQRARVVK